MLVGDSMKLADETRRRLLWTIGGLAGRIRLFLVGLFFLSPWYWALFGTTSWDHWAADTILFFMSSFAAIFLFAALFGSKRFLEKAGNAAGSHEVVIVFFLAAMPIAW